MDPLRAPKLTVSVHSGKVFALQGSGEKTELPPGESTWNVSASGRYKLMGASSGASASVWYPRGLEDQADPLPDSPAGQLAQAQADQAAALETALAENRRLKEDAAVEATPADIQAAMEMINASHAKAKSDQRNLAIKTWALRIGIPVLLLVVWLIIRRRRRRGRTEQQCEEPPRRGPHVPESEPDNRYPWEEDDA